MKPKVTFCIPTISEQGSKRDKYLSEVINCIQIQNCQDYEVFIYDNTDKGRDITVPDDRYKVIHTGGWNISQCNNNAMYIANSDVLLLGADDDLFFPERADLTYAIINNGIDLVYYSYILINADRKFTGIWISQKFDFEKHYYYGSDISLCTGAVRISKSPKWREDIRMISDYSFIIDCYKAGLSFRNITFPMGCYRVHGENLSIKRRDWVEEDTLKIREIYKDNKIRSMKISSLEE